MTTNLQLVVDNTAGNPELTPTPPGSPSAAEQRPKLKPTAEQQQAIDTIQAHFRSDDENQPYFVLEGPAGCGKTFCVSSSTANLEPYQVAFTAPTNKATRVLSDTLRAAGFKNPTCSTIYSLLGLQMQPNGEIKELRKRDTDVDLSELRAIVVDEAFMIGEGTVEQPGVWHFIKFANRAFPHIRWLFPGDPYQLPPVNEDTSPIEKLDNKTRLNKVMRTDNQILTLSSRLRDCIDAELEGREWQIPFESDHSDDEGVWDLSERGFRNAILYYLDDFKSGNSRAIAWRNVQVDYLNSMIRDELFGENKARQMWLPGDRLTTTDPCKDIVLTDRIMATTDEDGVVVHAEQAPHPIYPDLQCWRVEALMDTVLGDSGERKSCTFWTLHPKSQPKFKSMLADLAKRAQDSNKAHNRAQAWKPYWALREAVHEVRHSYAITAHRSQGSTFQRAFVNWRDMMRNQNQLEALKLMYVGCSRPKVGLFLG